jgi:hypothetical protein
MESFFETGELRVGTLRDYQDSDVYGKAIGDENEGTMKVAQRVEHLTAAEAPAYPGMEKRIHMLPGATLSNGRFSFPEESPDRYMFSTSTAYSQDVQRR